MIRSHVVVDGSNIATEGRTTPSLRQLDDAVKAFLAEHPVDSLTVVVDATFPNRIDPAERAEYEEALLAGELVTPPAGAIGRGDAFILQIADRVDATVLSNDSFQELHAVHPWLFDEGRLIGGKPVPGVGWVFLLRSPVRGPVSRRATREARGRDRTRPTPSGPSGDGETGRRKRGSAKKRDEAAAGPSKPAKASTSTKASKGRSAKKPSEPLNEPLPFIEFVGSHPIGSTLDGEVESFSSHGAYVLAGGARCYVPLKLMGDPAPRAARDVLTLGETRRFAVHSVDAPRRGIDLALVAGATVRQPTETAETSTTARKAKLSKAPSPSESSVSRLMSGEGPAGEGTKTSTNGADVGTTSPPDEHAQEATVSPVAKKAGAKKATAKKAPAKKTAAKKTVSKKAAAKKTTARKAPAKKTAAKKTAAKKAPAKKAPAKKTAAKKTAAKKTAAKKTAAKKTTAKKAPAKKTAAKTTAKKAPAKKTAAKKTTAKKAPARKATGRR
jgi:hypothetical protein